MAAVTGLCEKKQQVALLLKGVIAETYRAEELITQLESAHAQEGRTILLDAKDRNKIVKATLRHPINSSYREENVCM